MQSNLPHDAIYKEIFSYPSMVRSLLEDFVPEDFVRYLDWDTLKPYSTNHVTPQLQARLNDMVWVVNWRDTPCILYILTEFQRRADPFMALRMAVYSLLLWQDLSKEPEFKKSRKLPHILPIVLYNGESPWNAPLDLHDLIESVHPSLNRFQPRFPCYVVDTKRVKEDVIRAAKGEAALVMKIEQANAIEELAQIGVGMLDLEEEGLARFSSPGWTLEHFDFEILQFQNISLSAFRRKSVVFRLISARASAFPRPPEQFYK